MSELKIPEMVSIPEASKRTGISIKAFRKMVSDNQIAYVKCGRKTLINMDRLVEYLNGGAANDKS